MMFPAKMEGADYTYWTNVTWGIHGFLCKYGGWMEQDSIPAAITHSVSLPLWVHPYQEDSSVWPASQAETNHIWGLSSLATKSTMK